MSTQRDQARIWQLPADFGVAVFLPGPKGLAVFVEQRPCHRPQLFPLLVFLGQNQVLLQYSRGMAVIIHPAARQAFVPCISRVILGEAEFA